MKKILLLAGLLVSLGAAAEGSRYVNLFMAAVARKECG